ncbi:MAG: sugar porter family MFS transporter [Sphingobacteriales bacterium]|nr:sugar porter family MFS transporter [Sphingobacteriales bacterium]
MQSSIGRINAQSDSGVESEMQNEARQNMGYVVFLSVVAALGGFLFGYDTAVISGTIDQVAGQYHLDPMQQGWFVGCALVGSIAGVLVAGVLSDRLGRKKTMIISAILFTVSGVGCAVSGSFDELVINRIIGGVGIGVVSIISPLYISEVAITKYRGRLVSLYQLAITIGFLGAYLVNYELLKVAAAGAFSGSIPLSKIFVTEFWRGMLGMESLPAFLFFLVIFFIPESPRWLMMRQQDGRALDVMGRIYGDPREAAAQADEVRRQLRRGQRSDWRLLLKPAYFKALLIGVAIAILGQFMGVNAVLYYGPTIFRNSGLSDGDSLLYQVLVGAVNALTTVLALLIIDKVGRKKLVYYGVSGMILTLLLIAMYFVKGQAWHIPAVVLLAFFLMYIFFCAVSICAVIWVLLSEMYPTAVRGIAMSIAGFSLWIGTYLIGQLTPWMLATLSPAGTFLLFAIMCLPYIWIVWKQVPETAGKSLEEIERMWEN